MHEKYVSSTKVAAIAAWACVSGLMFSALIVFALTTYRETGIMLAAASCVMSAVAATVTIKIYSMRLCALIRLVHGLDGPEPSEVRLLR